MHERKQVVYKTPELKNMQAVVIDARTVIYIAPDADPKEAKRRYLSRPSAFKRP